MRVTQGGRVIPHKDVFNGLSYLHPSRILSPTARVPLASLPMQHLINEKVQEIDKQYRSILYVNWQESGVFKDSIPTDAVSFWSSVLDYRNLDGNSTYGDLVAYALACLTTPTNSAVVERIFSYVTEIKTKSWNKMTSSMLEAIVRIRTHLYFKEKCCKNFATKRMLELFTSKHV